MAWWGCSLPQDAKRRRAVRSGKKDAALPARRGDVRSRALRGGAKGRRPTLKERDRGGYFSLIVNALCSIVGGSIGV